MSQHLKPHIPEGVTFIAYRRGHPQGTRGVESGVVDGHRPVYLMTSQAEVIEFLSRHDDAIAYRLPHFQLDEQVIMRRILEPLNSASKQDERENQ